ncbi:MAG: RidA family protein [Alphaproteobacteria bacterium]|nr:RidA family protein [Alphaproteobacteria bacterium]
MRLAIMHDAPDVAENHIIAPGNLRQACDCGKSGAGNVHHAKALTAGHDSVKKLPPRAPLPGLCILRPLSDRFDPLHRRYGMPRYLNPETVPTPSSNYTQAIALSPAAKRLLISGQVGAGLDGTVKIGIAAQTEQVFDNIFAVLKAAEMEPKDIVKIVTYVVGREQLDGMREVRKRRLGNIAPTSTLVIVAGLANPDYLVEIEVEVVREAAM